MTEIDALLRTSPVAFVERVITDLEANYAPNWHVETIAHYADLCRQKKIKRLVVTLPPRSLKSICFSVALPAFILGKDPTAEIICISYGQDFSSKLARDTRKIMLADWYQRAFPNTRLNPEKTAADEFETTKRGFRFATSVNGVLTGRGADFIIIDDPIKADDVDSEVKRLNLNNWYDNTLLSRLNNKNDGVIVIVMQRLHMDDLVGHVTETEEFVRVDIPAIATRDEVFRLNEQENYQRPKGEVLQPNRESLAILEQLRKTMGTRQFEAQYQQNPIPEGGSMIRTEWFSTYDALPDLKRFDGIAQVWDTASKTSLTNDFSACTTWGILGDKFYLLDVHRGRYEFPALRRLIVDHAWKWNADRVLIEDAASGTQLIQIFRQEGDLRVDDFTPKGDKRERVNGQTAIIEAGRVLLPAEAPWLKVFLDEVRAFPGGKYDDQVDSMSYFLRYAVQTAESIKNLGRQHALRSERPARPGVEPAETSRVYSFELDGGPSFF